MNLSKGSKGSPDAKACTRLLYSVVASKRNHRFRHPRPLLILERQSAVGLVNGRGNTTASTVAAKERTPVLQLHATFRSQGGRDFVSTTQALQNRDLLQVVGVGTQRHDGAIARQSARYDQIRLLGVKVVRRENLRRGTRQTFWKRLRDAHGGHTARRQVAGYVAPHRPPRVGRTPLQVKVCVNGLQVIGSRIEACFEIPSPQQRALDASKDAVRDFLIESRFEIDTGLEDGGDR